MKAMTKALYINWVRAPGWQAIWLSIALILSPGLAAAETLMLIHGFLANGEGWRDSGVTHILTQAGWQDAGELSLAQESVRSDQPPTPALRRFYTVDLPTYTPLMVQAQRLGRYIDFVRERHPYSALILAGHSAGGVLARLYMVQHKAQPFAALITVASPHLGTPIADLGLAAGEQALSWMATLIGKDALDYSWGLFRDLEVERPHNFLGWLNHQPYPPAIYTSIVHEPRAPYIRSLSDWLVPAWSQDMNDVYALHGRTDT
ncbi:MAG TPA: alpha/beta fold hydrolase, partial [Gammaproteobacteria bacterium]|nr:alpha/beta fold hydrolase [Gammaproteobacteria bacterium]